MKKPTRHTKLTPEEVAIRGEAMTKEVQEELIEDNICGEGTVLPIALGYRDPSEKVAEQISERTGISMKVLRPDLFDPVRRLEKKYRNKKDDELLTYEDVADVLDIDIVDLPASIARHEIERVSVFTLYEVRRYAKSIGGKE